MEIDYEKLRSDLINYFGSAMFSGLPMAIVDLSDVEVASNDKLIEIAIKNNLDLTKYQIEEENRNLKINSKKFKRKIKRRTFRANFENWIRN